jgi:dihydrofolate synthase / folylpolyglutamate synthase
MKPEHKDLEAWLVQNIGLEMFRGGFERAKKALTPYKELFERRQIKILTIAGTNGKGQVAFECERHGHYFGFKTALWTSPHILRVTERFRFQGQELAPTQLLSIALELFAQGHQDLSYYEFLLLCFCEQVKRDEKINLIIFEVGLGGLLDAVNVFDACIVGLTSISRDHTQILGSTLKEICLQKWGVTRRQGMVVSGIEQPELQELTRSWSFEQSIHLVEIDPNDYPHYFDRNLAVAATLMAHLVGDKEKFIPLLENAKKQPAQSPGRYEEMTLGALRFIFIGAHNSDGHQKMTKMLEYRAQNDLVFDAVMFSFSTRPMDELQSLMDEVIKGRALARKWWFCRFDHPKALSVQEIEDEPVQNFLKALLANRFDSVAKAMDQLQFTSEQTILVTGSYYFIGEVQKCIYNLLVDHNSSDHQSSP